MRLLVTKAGYSHNTRSSDPQNINRFLSSFSYGNSLKTSSYIFLQKAVPFLRSVPARAVIATIVLFKKIIRPSGPFFQLVFLFDPSAWIHESLRGRKRDS